MTSTTSVHRRLIVPPREGRALNVRAGQRVRIVDLEGQQVGDVFAFCRENPNEYHSAEHTRAHVGRLFPAVGEQFVTNLRRPILRLIEDTSEGIHDMLIAACDLRRYEELGAAGWHASCAENLSTALGAIDVKVETTPQPINVFMNIPVRADGGLAWLPSPARPGESITFEAEMDCTVVVSACPQDLVNINGPGPTSLAIDLLAPLHSIKPRMARVEIKQAAPGADERLESTMNKPRFLHRALTPIRLGEFELPNRFAVAPMTRISAQPDGVPTPEMADYYASYARGGFSMLITEGTYTDVSFSQGYLNQPGIATQPQREAWRQVVDAVHTAGSRIVLQLMHAGALSQGNVHRPDTAGPSAVRPRGEMMADYGGDGQWPIPKEISPAEIEEATNGFVRSAVAAQEAGFDGIEVHAANGYMLDQFITDYTNRRTDNYGGPVGNRVRLVAEIVTRIRAAVGPQFCLGVRLSQTKVNDFEYRWPGGARDAEVIFKALAVAGPTYLHIASEGRNWIETARLEDGVTITGLARQLTGLPVIANGGMHDYRQAQQVLDEGHADIVSLGRGALANEDYPQRLASGQELREFDHMMVHPMPTLENAQQWRARD